VILVYPILKMYPKNHVSYILHINDKMRIENVRRGSSILVKNISAWGLRMSIITFAFLHFVTAFWGVDFLVFGLELSGLTLFIFSIGYFSVPKFKLPLTIFIAGIIVLMMSGHSLCDGVTNGIILMRSMVGLL